MTLHMDIAARLVRERKADVYTYRQLSDRTLLLSGHRVACSFLSDIEKGKKSPTLVTLERIAAAYKMPVCELLTCEETQ